MLIQEPNESKFFAWLETKVTIAQGQEIQKSKTAISLILIQKKVIKKSLFTIENADEVSSIIGRIPSCFASNKIKKTAIQFVTLYANYLRENAQASCIKEKHVHAQAATQLSDCVEISTKSPFS